MRPRAIHSHERNALYLLSALCMVFMTLVVAIQPLFLRNVLNVSFSTAGAINANVQVVTEVLDLFVFAYMGYLSDRLGRVRIIVAGFLVATAGAMIAPFSPLIGGTGALVVYYLSRVIMSLGTGAVWPQLSALAGDFSDEGNRARLMSNTAMMMAFGVTLVYAVLMQIPRHLGITGTMLMTAGIAGVAAWLSRNFLVDVAPRTSESSIPWRRIWHLVKDEPRLRLAFASSFFARSDMVFVGLFLMLWFIYFADLVKTGQADAAAHAGLLIGLMGAVVMLSIPAWRAFIERFGRIRAIILGMSLSAAGFISLGLIVNPFSAAIILPVLLFSAGQAGCFIAPQILTVDHAPKELLGSVLGVFNVLGGIGIIFFVQIGGFLFDYVGPPAPFVFTGVGNLIITIFAVRILKEERRLSVRPDGIGVEEVTSV